MRTLAVSIGNTSLFAGVFGAQRLTTSFRLLPAELPRLPGRVRGLIDRAVFCSVVPALTPKLRILIRTTWRVDAEQLDAGAPHGLQIGYRTPAELGADRIAAALGAQEKFSRKNIVIVDCGTATTVTALCRDGRLLGGVIFPGISLWPEMLARRTAQLPRVSLSRPDTAVGRSTREGIANGIFIGHVGAIRETVGRVRAEAFGRSPTVIVGTGGHAPLLAAEKLFTAIEPTLVLDGLRGFAEREVRARIFS